MLILKDTDTLTITTSAGTDVTYYGSAVVDNGTSLTYESVTGSSNGATAVAALTPTASTSKLVKSFTFFNSGTVTRVLRVYIVVGASEFTIAKASLAAGESLTYSEKDGWVHFDSQGRPIVATQYSYAGYTGFSRSIIKTGTAPEAAGSTYSFLKDAGLPGAVAVGTPGVAGRTLVSEPGCVPLPTPTGSLYLTKFVVSASTAATVQLFDFLWINTGLVVTTTTAQTVNSVALPARDNNGSINGEGCLIGMLFTAAATNAAAIANSTVSYTNSAGTAGRTATLVAVAGMQIPATPVIGTIVWFSLQAGDSGVKSIESVTLGTSLVTGSISMIIARPIDFAFSIVANLPGQGVATASADSNTGVQIYTGSTLILNMIATATTANAVQGIMTFVDR